MKRRDGSPTGSLFDWPAQRPWVLAWLGAAAIFAAYSRVFGGEFLWDDDAHITNNPCIVGPLGLKEIWTTAAANYFPLTTTSFWLVHALWGLAPVPYHLLGVGFQVGCALLLWRILVRLDIPGAWFGSMLWALHPVQVESVAWICELKNTQACFFFLSAIWFFVRWMPAEAARRTLAINGAYGLALTAAALAILSKSSTVMLPVVLCLVAWWRGARNWRDLVWVLPFFLLSAAAGGWTIWEQRVHSMAAGPEWDMAWATRVIVAGKVVWFYLGKFLWPSPLVFIYPRWEIAPDAFVEWLPVLAAVAVAIGLGVARDRRWRPVIFAGAYFAVSLFPVMGFFNVFFFRYSFVGDHFQHLASIGPAVLIGAGLSRWAAHGGARWRAVGRFGTAAILVGCAGLTWRQSGIYLNREALWRDTVQKNPQAWIAQVNLGAELAADGRNAEAADCFAAALRLRPDDFVTLTNLGNALYQVGRHAEAAAHFEAAIRAHPTVAAAFNGLGLALAAGGRAGEALKYFQRAVVLQPDYAEAHYNLGNQLSRGGEEEAAAKHFDAAAQARPTSALFGNAAGDSLGRLGRPAEARLRYEAVVRADEKNLPARLALAWLEYRSGQWQKAIDHAEAAVRLAPDHVEPRKVWGGALFQQGRVREAVPHFAAVVRAQPESAEAQANLGAAWLQIGALPEAITSLGEAVRLQPAWAEARVNWGLALARAGRKAEAVAQWSEALRLDPSAVRARQFLDEAAIESRRPAGLN